MKTAPNKIFRKCKRNIPDWSTIIININILKISSFDTKKKKNEMYLLRIQWFYNSLIPILQISQHSFTFPLILFIPPILFISMPIKWPLNMRNPKKLVQ